jgi:predicted dehydrogenase
MSKQIPDTKPVVKSNPNRRDFFNQSGKAAAVAGAVLTMPAINVIGQNDVMRLGIIGSGKRGRYLMTQANMMANRQSKPLEFVAVADTYEDWMYQGMDIAERTGGTCNGYPTYQEMFEKEKNLDGIVIATPEHLHFEHCSACLEAGMDIYLEKPMVHTYQEGKKLLEVAKGKNKIVQVGTQRRSVPLFKQAGQMIKDGRIGNVHFIEGWWNRNFSTSSPDPAWLYSIPQDADEETCDWEAFLGSAPKTDFDLKRYFQWRCYWDYSNGIGSDLMVHQIDAIHAVMNSGMPKSVLASGGIYRWKDHRETPDVWSAIIEYDTYQVNYHARFTNTTDNNRQYGIAMYGNDGTIEITLYQKLHVIPEEPSLRNQDVEEEVIEYSENGPHNDQGVRDHIENWYDCVKSREQPNCTLEDGFRGAAIAHMSIMSFKAGKKVIWDDVAKEAKFA